MKIDYEWLRSKANRELWKLWEAQKRRDETEALDCALNAALTTYHLLEWRERTLAEGDIPSARDLLIRENNPFLNILHDIVTETKHARVGNPASGIDMHGEVLVAQLGSVSFVKKSAFAPHKDTYTEEDMEQREITTVLFGKDFALWVLLKAQEVFGPVNVDFRAE